MSLISHRALRNLGEAYEFKAHLGERSSIHALFLASEFLEQDIDYWLHLTFSVCSWWVTLE